MDELVGHSSTAVAEYRRGIPGREVVKGVFARFLPATSVPVAGLWIMSFLRGSGETVVWSTPPWVIWGGLLGLTTLGFGGGLVALRKWLFPDANVAGRRSVLAGVLAPLVPLAGFLAMSLLEVRFEAAWLVPATFVLGGIAVALLTFFPWLTETPEHMRPSVDVSAHDASGESHFAVPHD